MAALLTTSEGRRRVLKWIAGLSGTVAAALAGLPTLRALLAPALRHPAREGWIKLGDVAAFEHGVPTKVDFPETVADAWVATRVLRRVWVYTDDGLHFTVFNGHCPHLGCAFQFDAEPVPQYHREPNVFHCPCHHGVFDRKTGAVLAGPPPRPLDRLETKIENGAVYAVYQGFRVGIPGKVPA
jgi:menaquinol-cytochrome c reductase iron-sulfur subunit